MPPVTSLEQARSAAVKATIAIRDRDEAIRKAHAEGVTIRAIAGRLDLSSARVHQILHQK